MLRMEAFFLCLLSIIITDLCSAVVSYGDSNSSSSSPSGSTTANILVSIIGGLFLFFLVIFCILKKCPGKPRMRVLPLSTQLALAQQGNQYAPPSYNHVSPYGYPPPYSQPPPYEQPPRYSTPSAPMGATK